MNWKEFKEKWIWKKYVSKPYSSVKELMKDIDDDALLQKWCMSVKYTSKRWVEKPGDFIRNQKHRHQRANRGWSDRDVWSFDWYLAQVISDGLKQLKKTKHGIPCQCFKPDMDPSDGTHPTDLEETEAGKRWDEILDTIIYTFETARKIQDHDLIYPPTGTVYFTPEEIAKWEKFCFEMNQEHPGSGYRIMTLEEVERYRLGWKYFQEHFYSLWD